MTTAVALSGGANLGPMQAGAVAALMDAGVVPDLYVGSSVGALNAAFLATHPGRSGARELEAAWMSLRRRDAFRFNVGWAFVGFLGFRDHIVSATRMRAVFRSWLRIERFEEAPLPFAVVATDALSGDPVVLDRGEVMSALLASSAVPGILPPVQLEGRWLVDGSLAASCPVLQAQELGADRVFVVLTTTAPRARPPHGAVALAMNSVSLVTSRATRADLALASSRAMETAGEVLVVPTGEPQAPGPFDFRRSRALFDRAYEHAARWCSGLASAPSEQYGP